MAIPLLGEIERFINEHGSSVVLKEHVGLLNAKLALLKEQIERLEEENAILTEKCADLEAKVAHQTASVEYVEEAGALFKKKPGGGYSETPYCPTCRSAMFSLQNVVPFT